MIIVRDIFQLKFGKTREAMSLIKEGGELLQRNGQTPERVLTDLTGQYYTVVLETSFPSLSDFEQGHKEMGSNQEWRRWYDKFVPLVESGRREIFNVVQPVK